MHLRLACAALALLLLPASVAAGADTFDAGRPSGAPVLPAGGVAWGATDGLSSQLRYRDAAGAVRSLVSVKGSRYAEGYYATGMRISAAAAAGDRIAYGMSSYDSAASKYEGGDGLVQSDVAAITVGGARQALADCSYGTGRPSVGLGDGFAIVGGCRTQPFSDAPASTPPVTIDGAAVGTGGEVQAAGPFAAWDDGQQVVVYRPSAAATVGTVARGWDWALSSEGSVAMAKGYVRAGAPVAGGGRLEVTPPGGTASVVITEPGGIFGLRAGGGALTYETSTGDGELAVVVWRAGERVEVGRLWWLDPSSPNGFSTDGRRVAFLSARCGGADLTVAAIGEPPVDRRVAPCPVTIQPTGALTRRRLSPAVVCDAFVPPTSCAGRATVRAGGRVLARGVFRASGPSIHSVPVKLTAAGRRAVARLKPGRKLRARVQVRRDAGAAHPTSAAAVTFAR
jgi:hypothetical protein